MNAVAEKLPIDPTRALPREVEAARTLVDQLRLIADGDEEFLSDMVEGQTGLFEIIAKIDASELDDRTTIAGIEATIEKLQTRKSKAEQRAETKRTLIASALSQIGIKTHRTPLGTITVSEKTPIAMVTDEAEVPTRFWTAQPPKLDKTALNKALRDRLAAMNAAAAIDDPAEKQAAITAANTDFPVIPGTTLSNGGIKISIRR